MGQHVDSLAIGDYIAVRGPKGLFKYKPNIKKAIGMIAGGSGITPMVQVSRAVLADENDRTSLSLIFANVADRDILMKDELDDMAAKHDAFKVYYVLQEV